MPGLSRAHRLGLPAPPVALGEIVGNLIAAVARHDKAKAALIVPLGYLSPVFQKALLMQPWQKMLLLCEIEQNTQLVIAFRS